MMTIEFVQRVLIALVFAAGFLAAPSVGHAGGIDDLVVTTSGERVRCTIVELVPGESVTYQTFDDQIVTLDWADVEYAGAAADEPSGEDNSPSNGPAGNTNGVNDSALASLTFETNVEPLQVARITGRASAAGYVAVGYENVCRAPCAVRVEDGQYEFAVTYRNRSTQVPRRDQYVSVSRRDVIVDIEYLDRRNVRIAGWASVVGGGILAASSLALGPESCRANGECVNTASVPVLVTGGIISVLGMYVGLFVPDGVRMSQRAR